MAGDAAQFMLDDLKNDYAVQPVPQRISRLYDDDPEWGHMFGVLHKELNQHFEEINKRVNSNRHYWAENSRDFLNLMDKVEEDLHRLRLAGVEVEFNESYERALEDCRSWVSQSGGSPLPDDFTPIEVQKYKAVFTRSNTTVKSVKTREALPLKMEGEGSFARVYSFVDPDYDIRFALKRAKKNISERDLERFKREFDYMKRLSHPHLVEVYQYDEDRREYRMEFCDSTLRQFIKSTANDIPSSMRKMIALQFLNAIAYLHSQNILHRDISLQNVLLRVYDSGEVLVKVADFGLVKDQSQEFTMTNTEMRGTIRDPSLVSFKDYAVVNEMWAIAYVLSFIVTGREALMPAGSKLGDIVQRCASHRVEDRYQSVDDLIADIEGVG